MAINPNIGSHRTFLRAGGSYAYDPGTGKVAPKASPATTLPPMVPGVPQGSPGLNQQGPPQLASPDASARGGRAGWHRRGSGGRQNLDDSGGEDYEMDYAADGPAHTAPFDGRVDTPDAEWWGGQRAPDYRTGRVVGVNVGAHGNAGISFSITNGDLRGANDERIESWLNDDLLSQSETRRGIDSLVRLLGKMWGDRYRKKLELLEMLVGRIDEGLDQTESETITSYGESTRRAKRRTFDELLKTRKAIWILLDMRLGGVKVPHETNVPDKEHGKVGKRHPSWQRGGGSIETKNKMSPKMTPEEEQEAIEEVTMDEHYPPGQLMGPEEFNQVLALIDGFVDCTTSFGDFLAGLYLPIKKEAEEAVDTTRNKVTDVMIETAWREESRLRANLTKS